MTPKRGPRAPRPRAAAARRAAGGLLLLGLLAWRAAPSRRRPGGAPGAEHPQQQVLGTGYGGVHHLALPGVVDGRGGALHVFAKALRLPGGYRLRAFLFFEAAALVRLRCEPLAHKRCRQEVALAQIHTASWPDPPLSSLRLALRRPSTGEAWPVRLFHPSDSNFWNITLPELHAALPLEGSEDLVLGVDGWPRFVHLGGVLAAAAAHSGAAEPGGAPGGAVFHVQSPVYGALEDPAALAPRLAAHLAHHAHWGLAGTLLYVRDFQLPRLLASPALRVLLAGRRLRLVRWAELALTEEDVAYHDQHVVYSHALLSHWGTAARLFIADLDEFLAAPRGVSAASLVRAFPDCAEIASHFVYAQGPDSSSGGGGVGQAGGGALPLAAYRWRETTKVPLHTQPKSLVNPNTVFGHFVHRGWVCRELDPGHERWQAAVAAPDGVIACGTAAAAAGQQPHDACTRLGAGPGAAAWVAHTEGGAAPRPTAEDATWLWMYQ